MKVLLDENLDHRLRGHLGEHVVFTAAYMGWDGLRNGKLLMAAEQDGFDVFVTGYQTLIHEQNLSALRLAIIVLSTVEWRIIRNHVPRIVTALTEALPGSVQSVDCGTFSRKRTPEL